MSKKTPTILAENIAVKSQIFTVQKQELEFSNGTQVTYERLLGSTDGAVLIIPLLEDDQMPVKFSIDGKSLIHILYEDQTIVTYKRQILMP